MSEEFTYGPFRLEIEGAIHLETAFHVGGGERLSLSIDAPVIRDAEGRAYLPATSLRGALRDFLERDQALLDLKHGAFERLFGTGPNRNQKVSNPIARLTMFDLPLNEPIAVETRDHVRIDERWGAAADGAKFDAEAALPGPQSRFEFRAIYEGESKDDDELKLLAAGLRALQHGELRIGGKSGWGYGRIRLAGDKDLRFKAFERNTDVGLAGYLADRLGLKSNPGSFKLPNVVQRGGTAETKGEHRPRSWVDFQLRLQFEGPVLIKAPIPPDAPRAGEDRLLFLDQPDSYPDVGLKVADHVFVHRASDMRSYLPGSSLRGVFRSQASRIAQSLDSRSSADRLFGSRKDGQNGARGLIEVGDGELVPGVGRPIYLDHVAIDRITAAAIGHKKFAASALASPAFTTSVRVKFFDDDLGTVALWGFVLRDLLEGRLWAGSGVSRGYGYICSATIQGVEYSLVNGSPLTPPEPVGGAAYGRRRGKLPQQTFDNLAWIWEHAEEAWKLNKQPPTTASVSTSSATNTILPPAP